MANESNSKRRQNDPEETFHEIHLATALKVATSCYQKKCGNNYFANTHHDPNPDSK